MAILAVFRRQFSLFTVQRVVAGCCNAVCPAAPITIAQDWIYLDRCPGVPSFLPYPRSGFHCGLGVCYHTADDKSENLQQSNTDERNRFLSMDSENSAVFLLDRLEEQAHLKEKLTDFSCKLGNNVLWDLLNVAFEKKRVENKRTAGGYFLKLAMSELSKKRVAEEVSKIDGTYLATPLRRYQQQTVELATEDPRQNYVINAPTGSGKTRIFIEISRQRLLDDSSSKILVISPNIPLTKQHEANYIKAQFPDNGWKVQSFSSDNPVSKDMWPEILQTHSVMIMTAQIFLNLLVNDCAKLEQLHLMVLDEVHHLDGNSPYKKIIDFYCLEERLEKKVPQVLGFSASLGNSITLAGTYMKVVKLRDSIGAKLIMIGNDNEEIQEHIPSPEEEVIMVEPRKGDIDYLDKVAKFIDDGKDLVIHGLSFVGEGAEDRKIIEHLKQSMFQQALDVAGSKIEDDPHWADIAASIHLLLYCEWSQVLLREFGCEEALASVGRACADLPGKYVLNEPGDDGKLDPTAPRPGELWRSLVDILRETIPISNSHLENALKCTNGLADTCARDFPKFVQLLNYLEANYLQKEDFHGIIFVETRVSVFHLAALLRDRESMASIDIIEFTGQGSKKLPPVLNLPTPSPKGMTAKQQQSALRQFKEEGRKILVATRAAEEGLDIVQCEFVLRYSIPQTGIQRMQSKGRIRAPGSKFISFVLKGSLDEKMMDKSQFEEANLYSVMRALDTIRL